MIADASMNQRWSTEGATPTWEEGSGGRAQAEEPGKILQVSTGEWYLNPQICRHTVGVLMPLDARNPHPLTNPIHLPNLRRVQTLVVLPDPLTGSLPILTLTTLVSTTVVWMYGASQSRLWIS